MLLLDKAPRDTKPDLKVSLGPRPSLPAEQDHTTLFDVENGTVLDLGVGMRGFFSPDSRHMTWTNGDGDEGEVWVIDVQTLDRWSLGHGYLSTFKDNRTVRTNTRNPSFGQSENIEIDIYTGERRPYSRPAPSPTPLVPGTPTPSGGRVVTLAKFSDSQFRYGVFDGRGDPSIQFEAYLVRPMGPEELVVAATPHDGHINIYLVSIPQREASFIATVPLGTEPLAFVLEANASYAVWTAYCARDGRVQLYDRKKSIVVELDVQGIVRLTPSGLIGLGFFGPKSLIDPETLRYVFAIGYGGDTSWSPDYRYASTGISLGHGGPCP